MLLGGWLAALALAAAVAPSASAATTPSGLRDEGRFLTGAPAQSLGYGRALGTWSPQRIAAAPPLEFAGDGSTGVELGSPRRAPLSPAAVPFSSAQISHPERYPNRVHGKLVGTFAGLGDFACSATVLSSGSASLISTAGHCAYDPGSGRVASNLAFVPGFAVVGGSPSVPYGVWPVRKLILTRGWVRGAELDYDFSMMRTARRPEGLLQDLVGARGIGFNQPRKLALEAYGYPAQGRRSYDGNRLIRCKSRQLRDPFHNGGPRGRGLKCDQQQGASGGGWVAQHSFVVSNTSHGYPRLSSNKFYGPYYGSAAKAMYRADRPGWPSIGPVRCGGRVATIIGSDARDRIRGTSRKDVIATLGGDDVVSGRGGNDVVCAGAGDDAVDGGGGRDRIDGGPGSDRCGKERGGKRLRRCEGRGKRG